MKLGERPKRVLVVDDEADLCQYLKLLLTRTTSYQVETVSDPIKAVEMVKASRYNLVISDIRMPKMDGIELLRQVKNVDPNVEVIMLTGASSLQTAVEALQYRAYDYIEKPVQAERFLYAVGNALTKQELSFELSELVRKVSGLNRELKEKVREQLSRDIPLERIAAVAVIADALEAEALGVLDPLGKALSTVTAAIPPTAGPEVRQAATEALRLTKQLDAVFSDLQKALGSFRPQVKKQEFVGFVRASLEELTSIFPRVRLESDLPSAPIEVHFDAEHLGRALSIVLQNSVEAMGGSGTLRVSIAATEGSALLKIADSGPGFASEVLGRLFTPLFTTKGAKGTGLGLSIARKLIREQGGRIEACNAPEGGACLTVALPRR